MLGATDGEAVCPLSFQGLDGLLCSRMAIRAQCWRKLTSFQPQECSFDISDTRSSESKVPYIGTYLVSHLARDGLS